MFKQTVIGLTCFLAGLIAAVGITSQAQVRLELGVGVSKFDTREDGIWWQSQYPHTLDLLSGSYLVGVHKNLSPVQNKYRLGVRAAFVHLGSFHSNALAMPDENIGANPVDCMPSGKDCLGSFEGYGQAYGVSFGPTLERTWGNWTVQGEVGGMFYRSYFDLTLQPVMQCEISNPPVCEKLHQTSTGFHTTPYFGFQVRWAPKEKGVEFFTMVRSYSKIVEQGNLAAGGNVGLTGGQTYQFLAGLSVPL